MIMAKTTEVARIEGTSPAVVPSSIGTLGDHAGEFFLADVNKSVGIAVVELHFGLDRRDIIAIGDSHNDLEMIAYAGVGVAIEGGVPELLAKADLIVPSPQDEGLVVAFESLGLIGYSSRAA